MFVKKICSWGQRTLIRYHLDVCVCVCVRACVRVELIAKTLSRRTDGFYFLRGHLPAEGDVKVCYTVHVELQLKTDVLWNVTPCSLVGIYRCFGGIFCHYLLSENSKRTRSSEK
jgi:hypothetical protein